ncbi:hypothetical protein QUC32_13005 [Novosphingobium resinovorum]|uniref:hypothetical protein n=1 Tax=Novosphingobium TaxID=165696 RepID=UPI001B3C7DF7|nr:MULTISPECIES: hypothetical protein [Novosphingobium]MBF7010596.1 hypothetical protein [Novosphingobium sp. HR1a]WJM28593.1 hypothetical protein QUC32_13005 [Novosphingobium resinovorum]
MPDYGLDIAIPFAGDPDPSLPWADDDDALLVPGSLALFDASHSASPLPAGVPVSGADVPNIAWKRFRDAVGAAVFTGRIDNGTIGQAGTTLTVTALAAGSIVTGQVITGTGVLASTFVASQVSGTPGGAGVYTVNFSQSVASGTITATAIDAASGALTMTGVADQAGIIISERTPRGGLHTIVSQTNDTVNANFKGIQAKTALANYITANRGHSFYVSQWRRITRGATAPSTQSAIRGGIGNGGTNYITQLLQAHTTGSMQSAVNPIASFTDMPVPNVGSTGLVFNADGAAGPGNGNTALVIALNYWGLAGSYGSAATYGNKSASYVAYRSYIEDLTVSGRTFEQVRALDYALYQAAFAAGGRYAGDTFTAPAI